MAHLRDNDPNDPDRLDPTAFSTNKLSGPSRIDIKFSFGNCLDDGNEVKPAPPFGYVPEVAFRNLSWVDHLKDSRFPALAGWHKDGPQPPPHNVMTAAQAGNGSRPLTLPSAATDQQPRPHIGPHRTGSDLRCDKFLHCSNLMFCRASPLAQWTVRPTRWPRWRSDEGA